MYFDHTIKSFVERQKSSFMYTEYAGCAVTAAIPVKFGTAHGRSRPEVGSAKCLGASGKKGVSLFSQIFGTSDQKITPPTDILGPK